MKTEGRGALIQRTLSRETNVKLVLKVTTVKTDRLLDLSDQISIQREIEEGFFAIESLSRPWREPKQTKLKTNGPPMNDDSIDLKNVI